MGEKLKDMFPHKLNNDIFFKYKNILDVDLCLEKNISIKEIMMN